MKGIVQGKPSSAWLLPLRPLWSHASGATRLGIDVPIFPCRTLGPFPLSELTDNPMSVDEHTKGSVTLPGHRLGVCSALADTLMGVRGGHIPPPPPATREPAQCSRASCVGISCPFHFGHSVRVPFRRGFNLPDYFVCRSLSYRRLGVLSLF